MAAYDTIRPVAAAKLTAYQSALNTVAASVGHSLLANMLTKQADVALPVDDRYLLATRFIYEWARRHNLTSLRDAAKAVLDPTLREAGTTRGIAVGHGWGPPPWTDSQVITGDEYNLFQLPGTVGVVWTGAGTYNWGDPDFGVAYPATRPEVRPGFRYTSAQLFYGTFVGQGNNALVPAWLRGPDGVSAYGAPTVTAAQLSQHMHDFLDAYLGRYASGLYYAEITNELVSLPGDDFYYQNSSIGAAGGKTVAEYIATLLTWARAAAPNLHLIVNETRNEDAVLGSGTAVAFEALVRNLLKAGAPLDGVGFQCHETLGAGYNFDSIAGVFATYADLGLDVHVTEVGVGAPRDGNGIVSQENQLLQAQHYRNLIRAFLQGAGAHAKTFMTWGITDANAFDQGGLLWDVNLNKKLAYQAVVDSLLK